MLGNDIIDLQEVLHSGQASRAGFQGRICTLSELSPLQKDFTIELSIWILWALKESAYKCYIQAGGLPLFAPKKFVATVEKINKHQLSAFLETPKGVFNSQVRINKSYVLAESWRNGSTSGKICSGIEVFTTDLQKDKSISIKRALCKHFAAAQQLDIAELKVRKSDRNIPALYLAGKKLPLTVSLSHHGKWGLFSYRHENSPFLG